jgi:hypothetical protein
VYKPILIYAKSRIGKKRGQKTELNGRTPLKRGRSALDCSAAEEKQDDEEEEENNLNIN